MGDRQPHVIYDGKTGTATVTYNGQKLPVPGRYKTFGEAQAAGFKYAAERMGYRPT